MAMLNNQRVTLMDSFLQPGILGFQILLQPLRSKNRLSLFKPDPHVPGDGVKPRPGPDQLGNPADSPYFWQTYLYACIAGGVLIILIV